MVNEELEALESIYGSEISFVPAERSGSGYGMIRLQTPLTDPPRLSTTTRATTTDHDVVSIELTIPPESYPSIEPPFPPHVELSESGIVFPVSGFRTKNDLMREIHRHCANEFTEGEVVIFGWLDYILEKIKSLRRLSIESRTSFNPIPAPPKGLFEDNQDGVEIFAPPCPPATQKPFRSSSSHDPFAPSIHHCSKTITDRKSVFQGHVAFIRNLDDLAAVRELLKLNSKISKATHVMFAYRFVEDGVLKQDCDDDGEQAAGGRLLHLLKILDATGVVVFVARWYGGVQLGPQRFKHINQCARDVLEECGYLK